MGFLDNTGLTRFLNDIKSKFTAPKSIAYVESTTAKTNHAAGDHFMIGEQLKRATSAIATGETIGTSNSADDTVQAQIDTLRDSVAYRGDGVTEAFINQQLSSSCVSIYANGTAGPRSFSADESGFRTYNNETDTDICKLQFVTPASPTASRRIEFGFKDGVWIALKFFESAKYMSVATTINGLTDEKVIASW